MKILKYILLVFLVVVAVSISGQENTAMPERTPEQEAVKQTEKMQQELKLTPEQARQIHEINLKYARARKVSNTRSDAIQRIKDKEADISRILNDNQRSTLQNKRYERSSFQSSESRQNTYQSQRQPVENQGNQSARQATETQGSRTETQNQRQETQQPATRAYPSENFRSTYRTAPSNTGTVRSGTPASSDVQRSTYRSSSDYRSSVRTTTPSSGSSTRSSSSSSSSSPSSSSGSGRSSSTTQQQSSAGRR